MYFSPFGSKGRSVSALSPIRRRILSNLSCLMKNSASWLPISAVSGCYVRYRGGGAGERRGNCFGLQHCMIRNITATDLIHPHIPLRPILDAFIAVISSCGACYMCVCVVCEALGLWWVFVIGVAGYVTRRRRRWSWAANCGLTALTERAREGLKRVSDRDVRIKPPVSLWEESPTITIQQPLPLQHPPPSQRGQDGGDPKYQVAPQHNTSQTSAL